MNEIFSKKCIHLDTQKMLQGDVIILGNYPTYIQLVVFIFTYIHTFKHYYNAQTLIHPINTNTNKKGNKVDTGSVNDSKTKK